MTALARPPLTQTLGEAAGFVLAWAAASFAVAEAVVTNPVLGMTVALGVGLGLASAWFELSAFPRRGYRLAPLRAVALRTAFYLVVGAVLLYALFGWHAGSDLGVGYVEAYFTDEFRSFAVRPTNLYALGLLALSSLIVNGARQVRLVLGPGTLTALLLGRYRVPVREERAFLFLDLTDSTGLAQRLGPAEAHAFKNDFFADIAAPVLATGGRIYQYVGDEVVVTWRVRQGRLARSPVETFLLLDEAVRQRADHYCGRYGEVPSYKAGLHAGEVVTAEVGTLKKDLVHTGDTVNVAARVEGQCHALGARLLATGAALALAPLPDGVTAEPVGEVGLRGRAGVVRLSRILPLASASATEAA